MSSNAFFAMLSRMKFISRWGLMRNTRAENLTEHSYDVAVLAHALAALGNRRFNRQYDVNRTALLGLFHDASEILTGDLPTPVKYFNADIRNSYRAVEQTAVARLLTYLPEDLQSDYAPLLLHTGEDAMLLKLVKAADKLSALIKCIEEEKAGNTEFQKAALAQEAALKAMALPEVDCFMAEFLPAYCLTLDEQE